MGFNQLSLIRKAAITGVLAALAMPVFASSDEAWAEHDRKVSQKCTAASGPDEHCGFQQTHFV